jgi:hypothetical protein
MEQRRDPNLPEREVVRMRRQSGSLIKLFAAFVITLSLPAATFAQSGRSSILRTGTYASSAGVPGASVTVVNVGTQAKRTVTTNERSSSGLRRRRCSHTAFTRRLLETRQEGVGVPSNGEGSHCVLCGAPDHSAFDVLLAAPAVQDMAPLRHRSRRRERGESTTVGKGLGRVKATFSSIEAFPTYSSAGRGRH